MCRVGGYVQESFEEVDVERREGCVVFVCKGCVRTDGCGEWTQRRGGCRKCRGVSADAHRATGRSDEEYTGGSGRGCKEAA